MEQPGSHLTDFPKIYRENSSFITIWQEQPVLYMKTDTHFLSYLAKFFLEWEMFQTDVVGEIKTQILRSVTLPRKSCRLWDKVEKCFRAGADHRWQYGGCALHAGYLGLHERVILLRCHTLPALLNFWRRNYFFFNFSTPVYKMWIIQEPNTLELWNKLHFEEKKKRRVYTMFKIFSTYICWIST